MIIWVPKTSLRARKSCNLHIKLNICGFGIKIEVSKKHKKHVKKNMCTNGVQNPRKP